MPGIHCTPTQVSCYSKCSLKEAHREAAALGGGAILDAPHAMVQVAAIRQVVTRAMLLEKVWDYHFDPQTNVIDVHVSRLRGKIDKEFDTPLLHTVRGAGYRLTA